LNAPHQQQEQIDRRAAKDCHLPSQTCKQSEKSKLKKPLFLSFLIVTFSSPISQIQTPLPQQTLQCEFSPLQTDNLCNKKSGGFFFENILLLLTLLSLVADSSTCQL
jgi:hypothetical protein